jgi:hypothetical protein
MGFLACLLITVGTASQAPGPDVGAAEFDARVRAYVALQQEQMKGAAKLSETSKPEEISGAEALLANRIVAARPQARRGDIITPAAEAYFKRVLSPHMKGEAGQNTRGVIRDEGPPPTIPFAVNKAYPKDQPAGTVPPNVLKALPPLPEGIEYRFIGRHLLLRDNRANLVIDYMLNAIP